MTVYIFHFLQPVPRGQRRDGTPLYTQHYMGEADDLITRIDQHVNTMWVPLEEPVVLENGGIRRGETHGVGATLMGFVNHLGIDWKLARTWDGAGREWEHHLKSHYKNTRKLCPDCNPNAYKLANRVFI